MYLDESLLKDFQITDTPIKKHKQSIDSELNKKIYIEKINQVITFFDNFTKTHDITDIDIQSENITKQNSITIMNYLK